MFMSSSLLSSESFAPREIKTTHLKRVLRPVVYVLLERNDILEFEMVKWIPFCQNSAQNERFDRLL